MSAPQVVSGTITFATRRAFCNGFGIVTADEDKDGADGGEISEQDVMKIYDLLAATEWDESKIKDFLAIYETDAVERLRAVHARPVIGYLSRIVRKKGPHQ
jgi:hypothetical protein